MSKPFQFKQFTVQQDKCAMKVSTDSVLLGAWADLAGNPSSILDIGAGTGLLALMLAQRSQATQIDAIEIDEEAYEQCVDNFENSPWNDRLFCYHASLNEFVKEMDERYDLIISNPPFYIENVSSGNASRDKARQNKALPFEELIESVYELLSESGTFNIVIPYKEEASFVKIARDNGLFLKRITRVKGQPDSYLKRSFLEFGFYQYIYPVDELIIEKSRHNYTSKYIDLTKDFYLKM